MARRRYLLANAVILFIIGASFHDIVRKEEHWPFSDYPMFNRVMTSRELTRMRLYGVTQDGQEISLIRYADVFPFDQSRLSLALGSMASRPDAGQELHVATADCLERYERLREKGWHNGPRLTRMRLYQVRWTLDPAAANVHSPDSRRLLAEAVP